MSLEDKLKRIKELDKIQYLSDQEVEERAQLLDEMRLMRIQSGPLHNNNNSYPEIETITTDPKNYIKIEEAEQRKPSLLRRILRVEQKQPQISKQVTQAELDQLTLEARKQELLLRIAKAKSQQKQHKGSIFESIQKVIGKPSYDPFDMTQRKQKDKYNPF